MVIGFVEISVIILALIVAYVLYKIVETLTHLVLHAVVGAIIILAAKFLLGYQIALTWIVWVVVALGGSIGAIAIIILHAMGIAF